MKKVLSIILSVVLIFSLSVSSFAAMYTFRTTEDDGSSWIYHFGSFEQDATDAGVYVNGTKYALDGENGERADSTAYETALEAAQTSGKYGIGFNVTDYTKESYELQSYYVKDGNETKGEIETIELAEEEIDENKVATLSSITLTLPDKTTYFSVPLEEGKYNYFIPASTLHITSNANYNIVGGTTDDATVTIDGATLSQSVYYARYDSTCVGITKEYIVTSKDETTKQKYVVQIYNDGYMPALEDVDTNSSTANNATTITTGRFGFALVKFYIGNLKNISNLNTVSVKFTADYDGEDHTAANPFYIKEVTDYSWSELTFSSDDKNSVTVGDNVATFEFTGAKGESKTTDITTYIKESINAGSDYVTLCIQSTGTSNVYSIRSKEIAGANTHNSSTKYTPLLIYTYNE